MQCIDGIVELDHADLQFAAPRVGGGCVLRRIWALGRVHGGWRLSGNGHPAS
jgi:hypothetical protein